MLWLVSFAVASALIFVRSVVFATVLGGQFVVVDMVSIDDVEQGR